MAKAEKSQLHLALDHAMIAAGGTANFAPYCHFNTGWLVGYDGMIAVGTKVAENLHVAPHTEMFRHAVVRAGNPYSLTVVGDGSLVVKGDKVRASVKTFPAISIPNVLPNVPLGAINAAVRDAVVSVGKVAAVKADSVIASAVYLRQNSVVATDGGTIVEGHHGAGLPTPMLLPVEFASAIGKVKAEPTRCGFSAEQFTVWYGETQWLRTNSYSAPYPDTDLYFARMMSLCSEYRPVPPAMLQAIETLKPFREGPMLTITDAGLNTRPDGTGASYAFEHDLPYRGQYPTVGLAMAAEHGQWIAFCDEGAYWYGQVLRGITALGQ